MSRSLEVWPYEASCADGKLRAGARLELPSGQHFDLWYSTSEEFGHMHCDAHDYLAVASIFLGMTLSDKIRIHGLLSRTLLANLLQFTQVWHCWRPDRYGLPDIDADDVRDLRTMPCMSALSAFSGGVDATCTLYRHTRGLKDARKRKIAAAVMVHGFDIPLANPEIYSKAFCRARPIAESVGVALAPVSSNFKSLPSMDWEDMFFAGTASALLFLSRSAGAVLIGSGDSYGDFALPWGSNPISDHLLGSREIQIITDGVELTRLEKVRVLLDWPEAVQGLRVCWEGKDLSRNCGICEKCVRTRLEFHCLGIERPSCFDTGPITCDEIRRLRVRNASQLILLREIVEEGKRLGRDREDWLRTLRAIVEKGIQGSPRINPSIFRRMRSRIALRTRVRRLLDSNQG